VNQYEVMYVIDTAIADQTRIDLIERFSGLVTQGGGQADRIDEWGKRRLAYAINYKTEGYYVLMYITAPAELPRELERNFKINENILRYLVIKFEGALPPKREPLKPAAQPAQQTLSRDGGETDPDNAETAHKQPADQLPPVVEAAGLEAEAPDVLPDNNPDDNTVSTD
jgi:small subunit ribosomal protein S6